MAGRICLAVFVVSLAAGCSTTTAKSSLPSAKALSAANHRIAAGEGHTCAIANDTSVWCWGRDSIGQGLAEAAPTRVPELVGARSLVAGDAATCASTAQGMTCWGSNMFGQLRMPPSWDYDRRPAPWITPLGAKVARAGTLGMQGACSIEDEEVRCWGEIGSSISEAIDTRFGPIPIAEQGKNEITGRRTTTARRIAGIDGAIQVAIGIEHLCALMPDGTVRCLGSNRVGQLGRVATPVDAYHAAAPVEPLRQVVQLEAGLAATCARVASGEVYCWGSNVFGQVGTSDEASLIPHIHYVTIPGDPHDRFAPRPIRVQGLPKARQLSVGATHVCAVGEDGRAYCWGANQSGQLGDGTKERQGTPVLMRDIAGAVDVAASAFGPEGNTCVLLETGRVRCVGRDSRGESGGHGVDVVVAPAEVQWR